MNDPIQTPEEFAVFIRGSMTIVDARDAIAARDRAVRARALEEAIEKVDLLARSCDLAALAFAGMDRSAAYGNMGNSTRAVLKDLEALASL